MQYFVKLLSVVLVNGRVVYLKSNICNIILLTYTIVKLSFLCITNAWATAGALVLERS